MSIVDMPISTIDKYNWQIQLTNSMSMLICKQEAGKEFHSREVCEGKLLE